MYGEALYKPEMKEGNPIRLYSLDEITEIHKMLHFDNADMSAVSFAMTVHGLMDYELDQKYGYDEEPKNLLDEYLKWFCTENQVEAGD